ncbi:alpha/beta fold hydrolase [Alcanivorax quisquiliarum]|uniref:Alpha/beta hydrolase n=1 Tax=Alcanivorax quisquiliarum TaxID=2933565 RepID=A0ABT0E911_9GAMM|nr:alpha/beta hydrolase [Alcanivorax quisquiliarum]MCK0538315.1 alpha/beta hydrolase [Alcanivorax quisquiliarum]
MVKQVELVRGDMRFPALMCGDGEPVLLLHGFPDCHQNWAPQLHALAAAGYCAVAPAMRGYAPSCLALDGDYSLRAAAEDICGFAAQLGGAVHLVGHDWGAAVGYLAAARSPELFSSLTALAIPPIKRLPKAVLRVPEQLLLSAYMEFFQLPLVPEWTLRRDNLSGIEWLWRRWSPGWDGGEALANARRTLAQPGVLTAALNWYRHLPRFWTPAHKEARRWMARSIEVPTLVMLGRKDGCMSPRLLEHTVNERDFLAGVQVETVADAGHFLHLERPERINSLLLSHLAASPPLR